MSETPQERIGIEIPGEPQPESRFIPPTDLCPHPERWSSTDGDSTEIEVSDFAYGLVRALQPSFAIETGAGYGQTTERIGDALAANGGGRLTSLENDPRRASVAAARCAGLPVRVVTADSLEWLEGNAGLLPPVDFAWLDTWYELRVAEAKLLPVRRGSILCFHDTAPEHGAHRIPSGRDLRSEIEHELGWFARIVHLPTPRGVSIAEAK